MSNKNIKGSTTKLIKHGANIPKLRPVTGEISEKGAPIPTMQPVVQKPTDSDGSGQSSQDQGSKDKK